MVLEDAPVGSANDADAEVLLEYVGLRETILRDPDARGQIGRIWEEFQEANRKKAFTALCVPSGTGKT